jgi:hypothetical protein
MSENTNTKSDKVYLNGLWLKRRKFADGGAVLKVSVLVDKFVADLQKHKKADGFVNFDIKARKEAKENGETHYAVLDTFVPESKKSSSEPVTASAPVAASEPKVEDSNAF